MVDDTTFTSAQERDITPAQPIAIARRRATAALTDPERLRIFRQHVRPDGIFVLVDHELRRV